jgi:pyruvate ferredoxin oxidoreductase beta subunit
MDYKQLAKKISKVKLKSGHSTCPGCPIGIMLRTVLSATDKDIVCCGATSCAEVTTSIYPHTNWNIPWMHSAFANAAATISGVEQAYLARKANKKITKDIKFLAFGGDGGSYDIGLASLSGALERGHNFVYICYNNEALQNTGSQRSSATPFKSVTKTTVLGKDHFAKNLTEIAIAHNIPYVANANPCDLLDLYNKAKKAFETKGPAVINIFAACPTNMKAPSNQTINISRLATETNFWPLYEYENNKYKINYKPKTRKKIQEFLKTQTKYKELLKSKEYTKIIQKKIDDDWKLLLKKEKM